MSLDQKSIRSGKISLPAVANAKSRESGEARSRKGQDREYAVLQAARRVLIDSGYTQFSLRNIAAEADMHLSNLQYYFPTRNALIQRLLEFVEEDYLRKFQQRIAALPPEPGLRFVAIVDYLIADIHSPDTRRFFIQMWALLDTTDPKARLLNRLYSGHVANLRIYIASMNPGLSKRTLQQRATMIAAMIDGMMLMLDDADQFTRPGEEAIDTAMRNQIVRMAMAPA
jgi:DNA-binding transcriptional regulator YbjK